MKKITSTLTKSIGCLFLMLAAVLAGNTSFGQTNSIKTNLANVAISGGSLHFEHIMGESTSAQLGVFIMGTSVEDTKFNGFGIVPQYRFYPGKSVAPHGFFVAPLLSYQTFSLETNPSGTTYKAGYSMIGAGVDVGKQW